MKPALLYEKLEHQKVRCNLCNWHCEIVSGKKGVCGVRENVDGVLQTLVYGKPCSIAMDPIEKKPLFHFHPGSKTISIGTLGCNLFCQGCQNFDISRGSIDEHKFKTVSPEEIISEAKKLNSNIISFTYNEPTMFYEYLLDIAKLAKKEGMKTVMVSNGYMALEALKKLVKYVDAFNIDLKGFNKEFYKKYCKTKLEPVLDNLKYLKGKAWLEVTNLIIPELNDKPQNIEDMCKWIKDNIGEIPIHFSRFFPMHKAEYIEHTPRETLETARKIAKKYFDHVYVGNIQTDEYEHSYCPKCKKLLIKRERYVITENNLVDGRCPACNSEIIGIWM